MSLDIDWSKLDDTLAGHVQQFLNKHFQSITKPSFIGDIQVTAFNWGNEAPQIEITNITEPFPEFYEEEEEEEVVQQQHNSGSSISHTHHNNSIQGGPQSINSHNTTNNTNNNDIPITASPPASELYFSDDGLVPTTPSLFNGIGYNNTARLSLNTPLSQQQRFNLMHSFHRSPFVAPQHPFNSTSNHNTPAAVAAWSTSNPSSVIEEDWIDDEEINPAVPSPQPITTNSETAEKTSAATTTTEMDFQVHMLISYKGDMSMTIMTELRMNYPSVMFMSLPINLCVKSVEFEATAVVAYIQSMNRVCVSMMEPEENDLVGGHYDLSGASNITRGKDIGMDR